MKRALIDLRSILWTGLMAGKAENARKVIFNGKEINVNDADHGYDNALDHILMVLEDLNIQPRDVILVDEGKNSKRMRLRMFEGYKAGREQPDDQTIEFNKAKEMLITALLNVGAQLAWQDGMEADDVIAYLARNLKGERWIVSNDGDLAALIAPEQGIHLWQRGARDVNPFGPFSPRFITTYKALVGDSSDKYGGAYKFGEGAWNKLLDLFGEEGLEALEGLIVGKRLLELGEDVGELKELQRVIDGAEGVYVSYALAKMYPEKVNTLRQPLQWRAGMVKPYAGEDRLKKYHSQVRLVHAGNYEQALDFFRSKIHETPEFCLDLETYVGEESDEWLERSSKKGGGVDVLGSMITGCGITFGRNAQYGLYISACHRETDTVKNCTYDQLRELLEVIPKSKITIAQNFAGFEAPVLFNHFGEAWKDNGWRGFLPNAVDSRIAASYWNEDANSHGLKALSKELLNYDQENYEHVTTRRMMADQWDRTGKIVKSYRAGLTGEEAPELELHDWIEVQFKMNELTAEHVLSYGMDDVYCTNAIYNHFKVCMEIEDTFDAFMRLEQKPMYLSAMSYVRGIDVSLQRLNELKKQDDILFDECERILHAFLIEKGWDGTVCPEYKELTPAAIKEIYQIVTGAELKTMVRTPAKLAKLIEDEGHDVLAALIASEDCDSLNQMVADRFSGAPQFDSASPKQVGRLLYEVMGLPIRLRNRPTDVMKAKGIREGTARTDDDAIKMAQKMDAKDKGSAEYKVLDALMKMKSINTKRGLYYDPYPAAVHWKDGRLHPELIQCSTNTRRWSSRKPNIQQLDREYGGIRSVILPHHRNAVVVSLDESSQEVRLCADYSKDTNLMSCYIGSKDQLRDVHSIVASKIAGVSYEEFVKMRKSSDKETADKADKIRSIAKIVLFASLYSAQAPKIGETLGIPEKEAQEYIDAIYSQFSSLAKWKRDVENFASTHGYVRLIGGTVRHLRKSLLSDNSYEQSKGLRQASNAMIQGAAASQMKTVMAALWDSNLLDCYDMQWMFPLHDEAVFSVNRRDVVVVTQAMHKFMVAQFLDVVPSASSIGLGKNFGELTELGEVFDAVKIEETLSDIFDEREVLAA